MSTTIRMSGRTRINACKRIKLFLRHRLSVNGGVSNCTRMAARAIPEKSAQEKMQHRQETRLQDSPVGPLLALLVVSLLWATYGPCLRLLYQSPGAPDPVTFTAVKAIITCFLIGLVMPLQPLWQAASAPHEAPVDTTSEHEHVRDGDRHRSVSGSGSRRAGEGPEEMADGGRTAERAQAAVIDKDRAEDRKKDEAGVQNAVNKGAGPANALGRWLTRRTDSLGVASAEIGFYSAAGTAVQAWGLTVVPAATAGFLIQFTTVITPTLVILSGQPLGSRALVATALATLGTFLTAADGLAAPGSSLTNLDFSGSSEAVTGRLAILGAACFYSLVTLRMSVLAPAFRPLDLALGKNVVMAAVTSGFAAAAFSTIVATGPPAQEEQLSLVVVLLTVWAGAGPGALGSSLQTYAQASVSATTAQIVFTGIPVWTAVIAFFVLGEQPLHTVGIVGALLVLAAGLVIASELE